MAVWIHPTPYPDAHGHRADSRYSFPGKRPARWRHRTPIRRALPNTDRLSAVTPHRTLFYVLFHIPVRSVSGIIIQHTRHPGIGSIDPFRSREEQHVPAIFGIHPPREHQLAMIVHAHDALRFRFGFRDR